MKTLSKALLFFFAFLGLISCSVTDEIPTLIKNNVLLTSGVAFDTKELITIDPFTGFQVSPCANTDDLFVSDYNLYENQTKTQYSQQGSEASIKNNCNTQVVDANDSLKQALLTSRNPIEGHVRVDGENKEATFVVTVTALYRGSHCTTIYSGGKQLKNCIKQVASMKRNVIEGFMFLKPSISLCYIEATFSCLLVTFFVRFKIPCLVCQSSHKHSQVPA